MSYALSDLDAVGQVVGARVVVVCGENAACRPEGDEAWSIISVPAEPLVRRLPLDSRVAASFLKRSCSSPGCLNRVK